MAKKETQTKRTPTRKQVVHSRREREKERRLYLGLGVATVLVIIVLVVGLLQTFVIKPNAVVATVNGKKVITRDYHTRVRYERFLLENQVQNIFSRRSEALAQTEDKQLSEFIAKQYDQRLTQLQQRRATVDSQVFDTMITDILVMVEATIRHITVSDAEVTEFINRIVAVQLGGLTDADASATVTAQVDADATAVLWTPTPTFTPSPTLTPTGIITQPIAISFDTPTPAPTPTLTIIDENGLGKQYKVWINALSNFAKVDEVSYRKIVKTFIFETKLRELLGADVPTSAEQSHARHILVKTEDESKDVIKRLNEGEDFAKLAIELSIDPGSAQQGGDLGFVSQGQFVESVDELIFSLPIGQVKAVESGFGWHVTEVLERGVRELSAADYSQSQQKAYTEWLNSIRAGSLIEGTYVTDLSPPDPLLRQ